MTEAGGEILGDAARAGLFDGLRDLFRDGERAGADGAAGNDLTGAAPADTVGAQPATLTADAGKDPSAGAGAPAGPKFRTKPMLEEHTGENLPENAKNGKVVRYLDETERKAYLVTIRDGKFYDADGNPLDTTGALSLHGDGPNVGIWVMDGDGNIYVSTTPEINVFHHSSFVAGGELAAAGEIKIVNGELAYLTNGTGHYKFDWSFIKRAVDQMRSQGAQIDSSQIYIKY
jgi:hypothetical protein